MISILGKGGTVHLPEKVAHGGQASRAGTMYNFWVEYAFIISYLQRIASSLNGLCSTAGPPGGKWLMRHFQ